MRDIAKTTLILLLTFFISLPLQAQTQEKKTYVVKAGDTLFSISRVLDVTVSELKKWNSIEDNKISIGQELIYYAVPDVDTKLPDTNVESPEDTTSLVQVQPNSTNAFYLVKSGDSLYKIAKENGMTISELKEINNLTSDNIRVGQRLAVRSLVSEAPVVVEFSEESTPQGRFALYSLKREDNLNSILDRFKMTRQELKALNPEIDLENLELAKSLTVLLPPNRNFPNPYRSKAKLHDLGTITVSTYQTGGHTLTTTNGELYNPDALTAAHSNIALGSIIFVENPNTGQGIFVRINDRTTGSELKLSAKAYQVLGFDNSPNPSALIFTES